MTKPFKSCMSWAGPGSVGLNPMDCSPYILNYWIFMRHVELDGLGQLDTLGTDFDNQIIQNIND